MNYMAEGAVSIEQRVILATPHLARPTGVLSFTTRLKNTFLFFTAYLLLSSIPLMGVHTIQSAKTSRFSLVGSRILNVLTVAKICSFGSGLLISALLNQNLVIITAGRRKKALVGSKLRFFFFLILLLISAVFRVLDIYSKQGAYHVLAVNKPWVKAVIFVQLIAGGLMFFFLEEFADTWGVGDSRKIAHMADYSICLAQWVYNFKDCRLQTGLSPLTVAGFSVLFSGVVIWLYSRKYGLRLESARQRGAHYNHPVKYMYCDTQAIYMATMAREIGLKLAYLVNKYLRIPLPDIVREFLEGERPYHVNYLENRNYLTFLQIVFTLLCYVGLLPLWQSVLGQGPEGLAKSLVDSGLYLPGHPKTVEGLTDATRDTLRMLTIKSALVNVILVNTGNLLPLFGQIGASNLIMMLALFLEIRGDVKKELDKRTENDLVGRTLRLSFAL